ncbi:MAG: four helix bundle protein [Gemmatimonadetes bacterium]|nr:MAG: four helix bundle protein [Gemmatimonadota bacterium]
MEEDGGRRRRGLVRESATVCGCLVCVSGIRRHLVAVDHYERLVAWRECHVLAKMVYAATRAFPKDERFGLTSQARRAAFSAPANIVEGSAKRGALEFRRFLDIALGSLSEVGYILRFSWEIGLLEDQMYGDLRNAHGRARAMTWKLYVAVGKRSTPRG